MMAHADATRNLSERDYHSNVVLLIIGGNDTTRNTISGSIYALNHNPGEYDKLRADPSLIPSMVSETIRWQTPLAHMARTATQDFELGGKTIKAGDKVVLWYVSGNFDEEVFERPDELDLSRTPNRHLAFGGGGVHFCLGNALGRQLMKAALREVYTQMPDIEFGEPVEGFSNLFNSMRKLPATWTP
jgi:cytochrome P450